MKFDVVVGNPPYQENNDDNNRDNPIYPYFYDLSEKVSSRYALISPARFLFDAGQTSKQWNQKMLNDEHLKVVFFEQKSSSLFPNTDIKGGVSILYWNKNKRFGPIETFTSFLELNSIMHKVVHSTNFNSINEILFVRSSYKFNDLLLIENPNLAGRVKKMKKDQWVQMYLSVILKYFLNIDSMQSKLEFMVAKIINVFIDILIKNILFHLKIWKVGKSLLQNRWALEH